MTYIFTREKFPHRPGTFTLGNWGRPVMIAVAAFLVFIVLALSLPVIQHTVLWASLVFLAIGVVLWFDVRRRIARIGADMAPPAPLEDSAWPAPPKPAGTGGPA